MGRSSYGRGSDANSSPKNGNKLIKSFVAKMLAPPRYLNPSYTVFSEEEGNRANNIQREMSYSTAQFRGMTVNAVYNKLTNPNVKIKQQAYLIQSQMPWNSVFMPPESTNKSRLDNPAQVSFVEQRQMTVPNAYGQFYAFMKALSAAFGTLQQ